MLDPCTHRLKPRAFHDTLGRRQGPKCEHHTCTATVYTNTAGTDPPHCGKPEDPAKMAYSRMDPNERGLSAKREAQNERTESRFAGCRGEQAAAGTRRAGGGARASQRTCPVDAVAEELEEVGIRTPGARTRAVQPWAARAGPRDALRASICSTRTHPSSCEQCESIVHASMRGTRRPRQNGKLENGTYRTRPKLHESKRKIAQGWGHQAAAQSASSDATRARLRCGG